MNFSELFVRRPVMTVVLTASAILFGVMAYLNLPVNDLPAVDYPVIQVTVGYPGATPETMANNVATPLERQFMQIPGLEMVTSNSGEGHTSFVLQFDLSKSVDAAATDVQSAISQATAKAAGGLARSADVHEDQSERSADYLRGSHQRHGDRGAALRLRQYAGGRAPQHSAGREPGGCFRRRNRRCGSRRIHRRWPAAISPSTI